MIYYIIGIIFESFNSLFKSIETFLNTKELTVGAILMGVVPFIVIWIRITKEKEKRDRSKRIEKRQLEIEEEQLHIHSDIRDLMKDRGVVSSWSSPRIGSTHAVPKNSNRLLATFSKVIQARKLQSKRRKKNMSRKLVMMVFGSIVMTLSQFGITLDPETIIGMCTLLISAIVGQSAVDTNGVGQYAPLKQKFKSVKLWTALGGSVLLVISDYYGLNISETVIYLFSGLGASFILGRSAVSVVQASKNGGTFDEKSISTSEFEG